MKLFHPKRLIAIFAALVGFKAFATNTVTWNTTPSSILDGGAVMNWSANVSVGGLQIHFDYSKTGMSGPWIAEAYENATYPGASNANPLTAAAGTTYIMRAQISDQSSNWQTFYGAIYNTVTVLSPASVVWKSTPPSSVNSGTVMNWSATTNPVSNIQIHFDYSTNGTSGPWIAEAYEWAASPSNANPLTANTPGTTYTMRATVSDQGSNWATFYGPIYNAVTVVAEPTPTPTPTPSPTPTPTPPPTYPVVINVSQYSTVQAAWAYFTTPGNTTSTTLYFPATGSPYTLSAPINLNASSRPVTLYGDSCSASRIHISGFSTASTAFTLVSSSANVYKLGFDVLDSTVSGLFTISQGSNHSFSDLDIRGNGYFTNSESAFTFGAATTISLTNDVATNGDVAPAESTSTAAANPGSPGTLVTVTDGVSGLSVTNCQFTFWNTGISISPANTAAVSTTVTAVQFVALEAGIWVSGKGASTITVQDSQFDCRGTTSGIVSDSSVPSVVGIYINNSSSVSLARNFLLNGVYLADPFHNTILSHNEAVPVVVVSNSSGCSMSDNISWISDDGNVWGWGSFHFYNVSNLTVQGNSLMQSMLGGSGNTVSSISGNVLESTYSTLPVSSATNKMTNFNPASQ
jgi:hypothetical protein